jgi:P27 family predicted phage terminase small subunit
VGRRGPAPTPTKVKLLRGETRPSRVNYHEPIPSPDLPKMPPDMDDAAKAVWRRVLRDMRHTGVIRAADTDILRCYCEAVSRYAGAARLYSQTGPIVKRDGNLVKNPLHQVARDNADEIRQFARELGLSPSARVGLRIEREYAMDSVIADIGLPPRLRAVGHVDYPGSTDEPRLTTC